MVYVDDILAYGGGGLLEDFAREISAMWETSQPEKIEEGTKVRFCGMEISRTARGFYLGQQAYIQEVLNRNGGGGHGSALPIPREMTELPEEENVQAGEVQAAQRAVGEILWLTTKTRPDLMYVTSRMSSAVTKAPKWVLLAGQVWKYLQTKEVGLWLEADVGTGESGLEERRIEVFTDASFSPGGLSHGSVAVLWNGGAIAWRSSRQSFPTMSTAESELAECLEGIVLGESVEALVAEIEEAAGNHYVRQLLTDSSSAIAIASEGSGSWRTRHLRVRAFNLRWRLEDQSWSMHHVPGIRMLADMGTKALSGKRLEELRALWKLEGLEKKEIESQDQLEDQGRDFVQEEMTMENSLTKIKVNLAKEQEKCEGKKAFDEVEVATGVVRMITVASLISQAQAVREELEENGDEEDESLKALMVMVSVLSIVLFKLVEMMCERKVAPRVRALRGMWADRTRGEEDDASGSEQELTGDARPLTSDSRRPRPTSVASSMVESSGSGKGTDGSGKGGASSAARPTSRYKTEFEEAEASSGRTTTARASTFGTSATTRGGAFNQGIVIGRIKRGYAWGGSKEGSLKGPKRESKAVGRDGASR